MNSFKNINSIKYTLWLLFFLFNILNVKAQQEVTHLTLEKCLDYGLENNYKVVKSQYDKQEKTFATKEAKSKVQPQVSASGQFDNYMKLETSIMPGEFFGQPGEQVFVNFGTTYNYTLSGTLSQVIFDPSIFTDIKVARNVEELSAIKSKMTKEETVYNICIVYYDLLKSGEELDKIHELLSQKDTSLMITQKQVELGVTHEIELNRAKVDRSMLEVSERNLQATISQQMNYLKVLIGMPVENDISVDKAPLTFIEVPEAFMSDSINIGSITTIQQLEVEREQLLLKKKGYQLQYLPTLSANITGAYQYQSDNFELSTKNSWSDYAYIGFKLSIPLYDGLAKQSKINQVNMQLSSLRKDLEHEKQVTYNNYFNAINQLLSAYQSTISQQENAQLAEKVYAQTKALYHQGKMTYVELLSSEAAVREAQFTYIAEIIKYKKAKLELKKVKGELLSLAG
ncbi:TolC family protein [Limibacter armeniacum]|uniref:TolC family protein n=1 Tax=Limibacter armeniacum TaxID=466084 RepID=UPI002FE577B5